MALIVSIFIGNFIENNCRVLKISNAAHQRLWMFLQIALHVRVRERKVATCRKVAYFHFENNHLVLKKYSNKIPMTILTELQKLHRDQSLKNWIIFIYARIRTGEQAIGHRNNLNVAAGGYFFRDRSKIGLFLFVEYFSFPCLIDYGNSVRRPRAHYFFCCIFCWAFLYRKARRQSIDARLLLSWI